MAKYYESYKFLVVTTTLCGIYIPTIEKIYGSKWYIRSLKFIFLLPGFFMPAYCISSLKYLFLDEAQLANKVYSVVLLTYSFFSTFIAYTFFLNKNEFVRMFKLWEELFKEEMFPEDRQELLRRNRKITNGWMKIFGMTSIASTLVYSISLFFNPEKELSHPSGIPYRRQSPDFELLLMVDLIVSVFGFALLIIYDCLMMTFLSLEDAQLQHLKNSLTRLIDEVSLTDSGEVRINLRETANGVLGDMSSDSCQMKGVFEDVEKNLKIWISHHNQVLMFHNELQKIYFYPLTVKYIVFVLFICLSSFLGVTGRLNLSETLIFTVFCCSVYATFYVNIKFADSITYTAETIFEDAFGGSWFLFPKNLRTAFHIIVMRSRRPVHYLAFRVYPLSSRSFLRIISSAYSFFTFLLHINRVKN